MSRGGRRRGRWWHADERCAGVALADLARAGVGQLADLRRGPAFELLPARLGESVQPPAGGVLLEALWCLTAHAAARLGEPETAARCSCPARRSCRTRWRRQWHAHPRPGGALPRRSRSMRRRRPVIRPSARAAVGRAARGPAVRGAGAVGGPDRPGLVAAPGGIVRGGPVRGDRADASPGCCGRSWTPVLPGGARSSGTGRRMRARARTVRGRGPRLSGVREGSCRPVAM